MEAAGSSSGGSKLGVGTSIWVWIADQLCCRVLWVQGLLGGIFSIVEHGTGFTLPQSLSHGLPWRSSWCLWDGCGNSHPRMSLVWSVYGEPEGETPSLSQAVYFHLFVCRVGIVLTSVFCSFALLGNYFVYSVMSHFGSSLNFDLKSVSSMAERITTSWKHSWSMFNFWLWILALGLCSVDLRKFGFVGWGEEWGCRALAEESCQWMSQQLWGGFGLIISPWVKQLLSLDTGGCQEALLGFSILSNWSFQLLWECLKWNKVELCQLCPLTWK